jgi:glycosyltransferase involved in cell wall biosynthesis
MDISVVIVTRNRAKYLAGALLSLAAQDFDAARFEVIVGDNGSTDATNHVAAVHAKTFANFHHFHDPRPGQIVGWHTALLRAKGEVVAFIDDDTRPAPGWLDAIAAVFAEADVGLATGPITPEFETEIPDWRKHMILDYQGGVWSAHWGLLDFGTQQRDIPAAFVWGRNFVARRSVMLEAGGFHPGGMPAHLFHFTGDGDMGAGKSIEGLGHRVVYDPGLAVTNIFQAHQNDRQEIKRWIYGEGLVTSYVLMRRLAAGHPGPASGDLADLVPEAIAAYNVDLDRIGHGYLTSLDQLPGDLRVVMETAGRQGFEAHQNHFRADAAFRDWVLRPNYLDIDQCYAHPDLH